MRTLLAAMALAAMVSTPAAAEIICTPRGCHETGMKIFRNGGAYRGLGYVNNRNNASNSSFYPKPKKQVRIIREY
jgi:hypothetical protein